MRVRPCPVKQSSNIRRLRSLRAADWNANLCRHGCRQGFRRRLGTSRGCGYTYNQQGFRITSLALTTLDADVIERQTLGFLCWCHLSDRAVGKYNRRDCGLVAGSPGLFRRVLYPWCTDHTVPLFPTPHLSHRFYPIRFPDFSEYHNAHNESWLSSHHVIFGGCFLGQWDHSQVCGFSSL